MFNFKKLKKQQTREFPGGPVVRTPAFTAKSVGSIPGWGTKTPQATRRGQKQNKTTQTKKKKQIKPV